MSRAILRVLVAELGVSYPQAKRLLRQYEKARQDVPFLVWLKRLMETPPAPIHPAKRTPPVGEWVHVHGGGSPTLGSDR